MEVGEMLISLKWLNEYVKTPEDIQAFCDRLDLTGTGVEGVERLGDALANVVTARVSQRKNIPIPTICGFAKWMWASGIKTITANRNRCRSFAAHRTSKRATI